jgi:hypothetical protein
VPGGATDQILSPDAEQAVNLGCGKAHPRQARTPIRERQVHSPHRRRKSTGFAAFQKDLNRFVVKGSNGEPPTKSA